MKGARTVHTHCTLCTRSFPRAHLHLRSWWTAIDIPPPPQLATSFFTLKTCSIHCFAHSHKTVAINLPTPSFQGKNAWSCCVTPRDLIPWEPLVLFYLTCKVTLFSFNISTSPLLVRLRLRGFTADLVRPLSSVKWVRHCHWNSAFAFAKDLTWSHSICCTSKRLPSSSISKEGILIG